MYLTQPLHRALQQYPDRTAVIDGDRQFTYREYVERVSRLAGALQSVGMKPGDRVSMYSLNSGEYLEYLVAVPWGDGVIVPINTRWNVIEIAESLVDSGVEILLVSETFAGSVPELRRLAPNLKTVIKIGERADGWLDYEEIVQAAVGIPDARRSGDSLAALFYTGGTTGTSKGVMLSHANLMVSALGTNASGFWATRGGRFLHSAPMFHLADVCLWLGHSLVGSTHVVLPGFDAVAVLRAVEEHRVTDLFLVPTMIQALVDHPDFSSYDLSSLRRFCYGASPIPPDVLDRTLAALPEVDLAQAYGQTELAPIATLLAPEDHRKPGKRRYSAGRAAEHSEIRVVREDTTDCDLGEVGEIIARGGNVMLGYWNLPDVTAAAYRNGWVHTGDAGYLDEEGYLFIVDRIKDMIVSGGENVYAAEVEKAMYTHPAISMCAVIGLPDPSYVETVHAVIVLNDGHTLTLEQVREHVKSRIAGYKAPRSVDFVDAMPISGAGKILKHELRKERSGKPGVHQSGDSA